MGYERHNAIIVSAQYDDHESKRHWIEVAHEKARKIFNQDEGLHGTWDVVSPVVKSPVNGVQTFLVAPDGSKEGWGTSDAGDHRRAAFIDWLESQRYGDLSSPLAWVEVQYGDERLETIIVNDSDAGQRAPCPLGCDHPVSAHGEGGCNRPCACTWER